MRLCVLDGEVSNIGLLLLGCMVPHQVLEIIPMVSEGTSGVGWGTQTHALLLET